MRFIELVTRFAYADSIENALSYYPDKNIIVFLQMKRVPRCVDWLAEKHSAVTYRHNKVKLADGREIIFMSDYHLSRGYDRNSYVVVNYL